MAEELGLHTRLQRQRSLSTAAEVSARPFNSSTFCCCIGGGGRRGRSLAECEFEDLFRQCTGFFSSCTFAGVQKANNQQEDVYDEDDEDLLPYKTPSRFKLLCRKIKAEARRNMRWQSADMTPAGTSRFHYDALSYAMNFDEGTRAHSQDMSMRLHSARFSGPIAAPQSIVSPAIPSQS